MSWSNGDGREGGIAVTSYTSPAQTSSNFSQRRRSSAAHTRPAAPPPNLPIPSIPQDPSEFAQPANSSASSSVDDLSDPPPPSILPASHLAVPTADGQPRIPSPRRALTRALELAREAVQLDSMNDNPELAVAAYGRSVALLSEVMERVRRGEESTESSSRRRSGRRRSVFAQEDEIRRLQAIHDTYADRMNILSIIYSIQPVPYNAANIYSPTSANTASNSPTNSSPDASEPIPVINYNSDDTQDDVMDYRDLRFPPASRQYGIREDLSMILHHCLPYPCLHLRYSQNCLEHRESQCLPQKLLPHLLGNRMQHDREELLLSRRAQMRQVRS
ncbi:hypothetical protein BT96DRAFT_241239 [Gymnopus androsaceus JB14]|uniref:MIT domain-containing protein n=1 Tax=Gymnopus androsaceus JB14 TaxID=1447944 RepID=A0A6A4ILX1_9AGAR|nr:hypothetical protein BT96DRAFT_241239 [Gymnopus androsaceus JB14]